MCTPPHRHCYHVSTLFNVAQVTAGGDFECGVGDLQGCWHSGIAAELETFAVDQKKKVKPLHYLAIFLKVKQ